MRDQREKNEEVEITDIIKWRERLRGREDESGRERLREVEEER